MKDGTRNLPLSLLQDLKQARARLCHDTNMDSNHYGNEWLEGTIQNSERGRLTYGTTIPRLSA